MNESNQIDIDITITMGETCSNTMTLEEARMLYTKLGELFGKSEPVAPIIDEDFMSFIEGKSSVKQEPVHPNPIKQEANLPSSSTPAYPDPITEAQFRDAQETARNISRETPPHLVPENQKENPMPAPKMPAPNLKVEAARERTAKRTSGCGSRNK